MSKKSKIQWCDDTVNPTLGCDGCELFNASLGIQICYAAKITRRFGGAKKGLAKKFEEVEEAPGRMAEAARWSGLTGTDRPNKPWLNGQPRLIFVSDMSDALSKAIEFPYLKTEIIDVVSNLLGQRHQWLWLTKQPMRMAKFSDWLRCQGICWPTNLWVGTSITTTKTTPRIDQLLQVGDEHTIRFVSVEPQWERIDLRRWLPQLSWVIQGGQSGDGARSFDLDWARDLRNQCQFANCPYFLKQLGLHVVNDGCRVKFEDRHAGDWNEWSIDLRVRQFPRLRQPVHSKEAV